MIDVHEVRGANSFNVCKLPLLSRLSVADWFQVCEKLHMGA